VNAEIITTKLHRETAVPDSALAVGPTDFLRGRDCLSIILVLIWLPPRPRVAVSTRLALISFVFSKTPGGDRMQSFVKRILRPWAVVSLASAVVGGHAMAADEVAASGTQAPASDGGLEEVVVTAQFRQQKLQDTPIAITAVNAAMLESRNQTSLAEVADQAPGVTLRETGGAFGPGMSATIRGIGQADIDPAVSPGVGVYIDDVY
jgi:TonB-dependent Receptor Plug Domain